LQFIEPITIDRAQQLNPLVLAFVGDAVQTLYVKERLAKSNDAKAGTLHSLASQQLKCQSQSIIADIMLPMLTEQELDIYRRARNSKSSHAAKNGSLADYKKASGLEAVFGFLYLTGQNERLKTLLNINIDEK